MSETRVVMFSGGVGSWAAAKRVAERHGTDGLILLFADTKIEDEDTYRFLREAAANVGGQLVEIAEGRTIWEVFRDERFLGNARVDLCSRILKREQADRWIEEHCDPATTTRVVGIDWSEEHRFVRLRDRLAEKGWRVEAPLCEAPYLTKNDLHAWAEREGLRKQWLYQIGMSHANCGGGCVKAGVGHFARLLAAAPARYAEWEANEAALRSDLGEGAYILRDRSGGETKALTLTALRERIEAGYQPDLFEIGGCGCMVDEPQAEAA